MLVKRREVKKTKGSEKKRFLKKESILKQSGIRGVLAFPSVCYHFVFLYLSTARQTLFYIIEKVDSSETFYSSFTNEGAILYQWVNFKIEIFLHLFLILKCFDEVI